MVALGNFYILVGTRINIIQFSSKFFGHHLIVMQTELFDHKYSTNNKIISLQFPQNNKTIQLWNYFDEIVLFKYQARRAVG